MQIQTVVIIILIMLGLCTLSLLWRNHIKNKCDIAITRSNCIALDRQYNLEPQLVFTLLDEFVEDTLKNMIMLNVTYAMLHHVNGEMQKKIEIELVSLVGENISNTLRNRLTLIYDDKALNRIIAERCYLAVLGWAQDMNALRESDTDDDEDDKDDVREVDLFNIGDYDM